MTLGEILRARKGCIPVPGCWDGLSAFWIERAGFPVAFLSGAALSMARFGLPDMGFFGLGELSETVRAIRGRTDIPLIVDADTGFGNALNAAQAMRVLEAAGASAIQMEDQTAPKRCGHMDGKSVIPAAEAAGKIRAVVDARRSAATLVSARTDAFSVEGVAGAIERMEMYLEAGADIVFVEGPRTLPDLQAVAARFRDRAPMAHNLVEGAVTPVTSGAELDALGFAIAYHPLLLLHRFARVAPEALAHLKAQRETKTLHGLADLHEMNAALGAPDLIASGKRYGAED